MQVNATYRSTWPLRLAGWFRAPFMLPLIMLIAVLNAGPVWAAKAPKWTPPIPLERPYGTRHALSAQDQSYATAFKLAEKGNWAAVKKLRHKKSNPYLNKVLDWQRYRHIKGGASFDEIARFIEKNPSWPGQTSLRKAAELAMPTKMLDTDVITWFLTYPAMTATGHQKHIAALGGFQSKKELEAEVKAIWRDANFSRADFHRFRKRYRKILTKEDHWKRLDRLLWQSRFSSARHVLPYVTTAHRRVAEARMALRGRRGGVDAAIKRIPDVYKSDQGVLFERIKWRRRKGRHEEAQELFAQIPENPDHPRYWWKERSIQIRKLLNADKFGDAYALAADHRQKSGGAFADAEWLAGWLALQFLDRPDAAFKHFENLHSSVRTPISKARGAYWAGRAQMTMGEIELADTWFRKASQFTTVFYGQLAAARISGERTRLPVEPVSNPVQKRNFKSDEYTQTIRALARLGQGKLVEAFLRNAARRTDNPQRLNQLAGLARSVGRADIAVYIARRAARVNVHLISRGYPLMKFPPNGPEASLTLAVIRQESAFDVEAKSRVGARGLMQLMPATAKNTAKSIGLRYRKSRLTSDPHYNISLGRAYLDKLLKRFDGNYIMAIAGYNAGPHRVKQWVKLHGDPRSPNVDPIDWIERIPFSETRNYVQRVLEALYVYRSKTDVKPAQLALSNQSARNSWCLFACGISMELQEASLTD